MATYSVVKGKRLRATRVDACGLPQAGPASQLVTTGFVTVQLQRVNKDAEDLEQQNAEGRVCVADRTPPELKWFNVTLTLCNVDVELLNMFTDDPIVLDYANRPVGFRTTKTVPVDQGVAVEVWSGTGSDTCTVPEDDSIFDAVGDTGLTYGYFLVPVIKEGIMGDIEIGASVATFTVSGITAVGTRWGRGPYNVIEQDPSLTPGRLAEPIGIDEHLHTQVVRIAPPPATDGATDLIIPRPYIESGPADDIQRITINADGGTFTLTHDAETTTALDFDSTAAEVQTELEALTGIGAGNVEVTPASDGWVVRFIGTLAGTDIDELVADGTNLTGDGASVTVTTVFNGG